MIYEVQMFSGECDNCGEAFEHWHEGWSAFPDKDSVLENMNEQDWFVGDKSDKEHAGKHYCERCFKYDEDIDDLIHVDLTRTKAG